MRIIVGILIAPIVFIAAWSVPLVEHSAFYRWLGLNTIMAYFTFLLMAGLSHLVLSKLEWQKLWQYCSVMFLVALVMYLLFRLGSLSIYESMYHSQTQIVENGEITKEGYLLELKSSLYGSALASISMAVFWFVSFYKRSSVPNHA